MIQKHIGWFVLAGAVFMLLGLIGVEVAKLGSWDEVWHPMFIGMTLAHMGAVGTAWLSGRLQPQINVPAPPAEEEV